MNDVKPDAKPAVSANVDDSLHERDFLRWLDEQVAFLRTRQLARLDLEKLQEEIEDMGNHLRRELEHRLDVLLMHLLKCQFQPDHKSRSWLATLYTQRVRIKRLLKHSPSLDREVMNYADSNYAAARKLASIETGLSPDDFPAQNPYSKAQILDDEFVP
ncbi:MAG: DUF29 domain-containing protein [Massilia sp.]